MNEACEKNCSADVNQTSAERDASVSTKSNCNNTLAERLRQDKRKFYFTNSFCVPHTGYSWFDTEYRNDLLADVALTSEEKDVLLTWICENLRPRKTPLPNRSSYGIKHIVSAATGIYISNTTFKDLMLLCGFEPVNSLEQNWRYCLSARSPAFCKSWRIVR